MKVLTFTNQKGGVGKTTTSAHLAHWLTKLGYKVAFLDADGQYNGTMFFEPYLSRTSAFDFFTKPLASIVVGDLVCLPAKRSIFGVNEVYEDIIKANVKVLAKAGFDYLIIDTAPSMSKLLIASLIISDGAFIPISMSNFSLKGVGETMANIKLVRQKNGSKVELVGLIPNMLIGLSKKQKVSLGQLAANHPGMVMPFLSNREPINDVMNGNTPLWNIKPAAGNVKTAAKEMIRLMEALADKIGATNGT